MSLHHVLEVARKNGMPVIITDPDGREPMVILPLEQFEALTGPTSNVLRPTSEDRERTKQDQGLRTKDSGPRTQDGLDAAIAEMTAERLKNRMEETARQLESLADNSQNAETPLEEGFYLEPLDDK